MATRVMTAGDLRDALLDAPDWRPITIGIETSTGEFVAGLDLVAEHGSIEHGEVTIRLMGREES